MQSLAPAFCSRSKITRSDPKPRRHKPAAGFIGAFLFSTVAAHAQAASPVSPPSIQSRNICDAVIGVRPSDYRFAWCVASLNESLQSAADDEAVARAQSDCFRQGLKPRTADLSLCLLKADDAKSGADAADGAPQGSTRIADGSEYPHVAGSYLPASFDEVLHREREACARLGIAPDSGAFVSCVSSLQEQLQRTNFSN
jgi:hypothetical protein